MVETIFVLGSGGGILEMDVPRADTPAAERLEQAIAKGDLTVIPAAYWVERPDGSKYLVAGTSEASDGAPTMPARPPAATKRTKSAAAAETPAD